MPLSFATRLRGVLAAAALIVGLSLVESDQTGLIPFGIFGAMPFLIWMLAAAAVKDAPPFDDTAFHRTRPVTRDQAFRRSAEFYLLLLAGIFLALAAYGWYFNLAAWEVATGALFVASPWIALVSLFATIASLTTSNSHSKAWGPLAGLVIPALSTVAMCWVAFKYPSLFGDQIEIRYPSYPDMAVAAAVLYPLLWWLVSTRRVSWRLGCGLALQIGILLPWVSPMINVLHWFPAPPRYRTPLEDLKGQRFKPDTAEPPLDPDQVPVSRLIAVQGLAPDEFIGGLQLSMSYEYPAPGSSDWRLGSDKVLDGMNSTAFSTDNAGRLVPATASLFRAVGLNADDDLPILGWEINSRDRRPINKPALIRLLLNLPVRPNYDYNLARNPLSPETSLLPWELNGDKYQWVKILEVGAGETARAKLPGGGIIQIIPPEESSNYPQLLLQIIRGLRTSMPWTTPNPAIIARMADGRSALVRLSNGGYFNPQNSFLTSRIIFACPEEGLPSQQRADLKKARLEVYWPAYRGSFRSKLAPPE